MSHLKKLLVKKNQKVLQILPDESITDIYRNFRIDAAKSIQSLELINQLRQKKWFIAPLASSLIGSTVDTFLFFSISFYGTGIPWVTLSLGDLAVKIFVALVMLIPFRLLLGTLKAA